MNILGDSFRWGLGGYENGPFGHKGSNWKTENAWDLITQSDTDVYSITDGTVTKIKTLKTGDSHLFGTSIEILGRGEYPTIFYCNLSGVKVRVGNKIHIGEKLGKVAQSPNQMGSYLHVALPFGKYISSLIQSDGSIKGSDSEVTVDKPKEKKIKPVDSKKTSDDDFATKITKAAIGALTPIGLASSLFEEVERIKELLK
jgi:murein DD-endopeptidase MepM/ murein hydrolase activator NlpD